MKNDEKNNIYELLNDISTDTSDYPQVAFSKEDIRKYKKNIKRRKSSTHYVILAVAACVAIAILLTYFKPREEKIKAGENYSYYSLSAMLGVDRKLEDYVLHIDETHKMPENTVTLNSVAFDEGQLSVSSTYFYENPAEVPRLSNGIWARDYNDKFENTGRYLSVPKEEKKKRNPYTINEWEFSDELAYMQRLYINGKEIQSAVKGELYAGDMGMLQDTTSYTFPVKELEFPAKVKLEIWKDASGEKPETTFEFVLKEENMAPVEKVAKIDKTVELPDKSQIHFDRLIYTALGIRLEAERERAADGEETYIVYLESEKTGSGYGSLSERRISDHQVIYMMEYISSLYSQVKNNTLMTLKIVAYYYDEKVDGSRRVELDDTLEIKF